MACSHPGCTCNGQPDLGSCPCGRWPLYVGAYDKHGKTVRCRGCLRIPRECMCGGGGWR